MKIIKMGYSHEPWRLVSSSGNEVLLSMRFEHPDLGWTVIDGAISGKTKSECIDKTLELLEKLLKRRVPAVEQQEARE